MSERYLDMVDNFQLFVEPEAWMRRGLCAPHNRPAGLTPDDWFPERGKPRPAAVAICGTCPVMTECGDYGAHERFGIWGGLKTAQRRKMMTWARRLVRDAESQLEVVLVGRLFDDRDFKGVPFWVQRVEHPKPRRRIRGGCPMWVQPSLFEHSDAEQDLTGLS